MIYNPNAGRFPSGMLAERAAEVLRASGWNIHLLRTRDGGHVSQLARKAADEGKEALFVVGGDGTINLAVRGLAGSDTALGVLPGGTANVLAQELGLPGLTWTRWMALEESARRLSTASIHAVDIGQCAGTPFLMWAGVGLDAFAIHHIEPRPRGEKLFANMAYAASTAYHASLWHGINLKVTADHLHISGHYLLALISNIHLYAGGLANVSPSALLDDGLMDLWMFEGDTLGDTIQLAWDLYAGRHVNSERVRHVTFKNLLLESDTRLYVQVDAEPLPYQANFIEISVVSEGLKLLVPRETPRELFYKKEPL
ncbi:MAG TPA: diacylglycerol kinase family protein [Anaerolineales bacterium]|nr:diacylglycerol kinase family protein [Anaerolineales bacterium]